jgi:hypothetical protein
LPPVGAYLCSLKAITGKKYEKKGSELEVALAKVQKAIANLEFQEKDFFDEMLIQ